MNLVRAFFPKSGHFSLNFEKGQGVPPPPPSPHLVTRLQRHYGFDLLPILIPNFCRKTPPHHARILHELLFQGNQESHQIQVDQCQQRDLISVTFSTLML